MPGQTRLDLLQTNAKIAKEITQNTVLDTARLRFLLGEHFSISSKNVRAYIMGEHGDSSFVPWSSSYIGCKPLIEVLKDYVGVPAIVGRTGVQEILQIKLTKEEQEKFDHSCEILKQMEQSIISK